MSETMLAAKLFPGIADARNKVAAVYREVRRRDPRLARLLYRKVEAAKHTMISDWQDKAFSAGTGEDGLLSELVAKPRKSSEKQGNPWLNPAEWKRP